MTSSSLESAVRRYAQAIARLESAGARATADQVLEVLVARDVVHAATHEEASRDLNPFSAIWRQMRGKRTPSHRNLLRAVKTLDDRLVGQAEILNQVVSLEDWQVVLSPPERNWLWLLDPLPPWHDRYDWFWQGLSLVFTTISLSLLVDTANRFLSGGPDTAGVFAVVIPAVLTLMTGGGALTNRGRQAIEHILSSCRIAKHFWDEALCAASFMLLVIMACFWFSMPLFADYYKQLGHQATEEKQLILAENHYYRALRLNSRDVSLYYTLGNLYRELQEFDRALENYKIAVKGGFAEAGEDIADVYLRQQEYAQADAWLWRALEPLRILLDTQKPYTLSKTQIEALQTRFPQSGNLARIDDRQFAALKDQASLTNKQFDLIQELSYTYLKQEQYADAYRWLGLALAYTKQNPLQQSTVYVYLGWIPLRQGRFEQAQWQLEQAIALNPDQAPAHCLQAQVLEGLQDRSGARRAWEQCLRYADQKKPDEDVWIGLALKSLKEGS